MTELLSYFFLLLAFSNATLGSSPVGEHILFGAFCNTIILGHMHSTALLQTSHSDGLEKSLHSGSGRLCVHSLSSPV